MNDVRVPVADARTVLHGLREDWCSTRRNHREINVSFRGHGGTVGRRDFATHWIHWYPAKMFHRIPSTFLDAIGLPVGANILDPFCGSGTVLLEANLRGYHAIGIDINPLARLISRVKITPLDPTELKSQLAQLLPRAKRCRSMPKAQATLDSWLSPSTRIALHRLAIAIGEIADPGCQSFFLVALTSIVRQVSAADPAIPPLVRLREERADSAGSRYRSALRKSRAMTTSSVYSIFLDAAIANIRRMTHLHALRGELGQTRFCAPDADAAHTGLQSASIDTIITSPPYCGAQKYVRSLKLELILSGSAQDELRHLDRKTLGTEAVTTRATPLSELLTGDGYVDYVLRKVYRVNPVRARMASDYSKYLSAFANECQRVLQPGGHLCVTLGRSTLAGVPFQVDRVFRHASEAAGLKLVATLVDPIPSRGLLTQRHTTAGRIDHEFIVWLRRPESGRPPWLGDPNGSG